MSATATQIFRGGFSKASFRDGNLGTGTIFYPWVALVPDPNRDEYFFHPRVTRWVPDTLLLL
jgi:hypothetical protein